MRADEPTLRELLEAARADCSEPLRQLLTKIVSTLQLHDERVIRIEETLLSNELLP